MQRWFILMVLAVTMASGQGCGKKTPPPAILDPATQKQMDLLLEAIATVQSNYVDESKVAADQIIAHTIRGMITPVDSHARVVSRRQLDETLVPPSVYQSNDEAVVSVKIPLLNNAARKQLRKIENRIRKARGAGIILDLRGASGHDYDAALLVLNWFLPPGTVAGTLVRKNAAPEIASTRKKNIIKPAVNLVLLIDENTEDAGEWIAAALKHHQRAILVGRPTRGLGLMRDLVPVTEEWIILMTAGRAATPDGIPLMGAPVQPDVLMQPWADSDLVYRTGLKQLAAAPDIIKPPVE